MKSFFIATVAAFVAAGATYLMVSGPAPQSDWSKEKAGLEATFQAERDRLQQELAKERKRSGRVDTVEVEVSNAMTPDEIVERLKTLHSDGNRQKALREIMFHFQSLVVQKDASVPAIRAYLALNEDVPYGFSGGGPRSNNTPQPQAAVATPTADPNSRQARAARGGNNADPNDIRQALGQFARTETNPTLEFFLPPSLRIGLIDVLKDIGGAQAEAALADVLKTTARGVEIALTAKILEAMAPGRYTDIAIAASKELIPNLPEIENPDRWDQNAKGYLYGILKQHNDTTFVPTAKKLLVTENGQIDRNALDYLTTVLKGQAVSVLMEAYNDPRMTNPWAKAPLAQQILAQVGANPQANELLYKIVADPEQNGMAKMMAIASLSGSGGGRGPLGGNDTEVPTDPAILQSRIQVLNTIRQTVDPSDQQTLATISFTEQNLKNLINGQPVQNPRELLMQMGGMGAFGGRGGNTGQGAQGGRQVQGGR
jgi:hypothetical protein